MPLCNIAWFNYHSGCCLRVYDVTQYAYYNVYIIYIYILRERERERFNAG